MASLVGGGCMRIDSRDQITNIISDGMESCEEDFCLCPHSFHGFHDCLPKKMEDEPFPFYGPLSSDYGHTLNWSNKSEMLFD